MAAQTQEGGVAAGEDVRAGAVAGRDFYEQEAAGGNATAQVILNLDERMRHLHQELGNGRRDTEVIGDMQAVMWRAIMELAKPSIQAQVNAAAIADLRARQSRLLRLAVGLFAFEAALAGFVLLVARFVGF